jgi:acyl transferase domain-containing protein
MLTRATMLSPDGRCKTLDASADGYVRGETCRALYLCQAGGAAAQRHRGDEQAHLGLLLASAVNTNGRASSLTAPNGQAQQALLREALAAAGLAAGAVSGLQMHSNGTALGDPIEVGAASAVLLVSCRRQRVTVVAFATCSV